MSREHAREAGAVDVDSFKRLPIMGILRGGNVEILDPLIEAVVSAGLETLEVAMNTPEAPVLIERARQVAAGRLAVGAGTVLTLDRLEAALKAGATFIVLPTLALDVVARCREHGIPVFPGALTPQEIHDAWCAGATMVKLFPAKFFGPEYVREIKGPLEDVDLLVCGGVTADNMASFFANGASAVAFGGSVFDPAWLDAREFSRIGRRVRAFVEAFERIDRPPVR